MRWLLVAPVLLAGCFAHHPPIREARTATRQGSPDAVAKWDAVLDDELLVTEWRNARRVACRLRNEQMLQATGALDPSTAPPSAFRPYREMAATCSDDAVIFALADAEMAAALREIDELDVTAPYPRLVALRELAPYVPADAPVWDEVTDLQEAWRQQLAEARDAATLPVTSAWLRSLDATLGPAPASTFVAAAAPLVVPRVASVTLAPEGSCTDRLPSYTEYAPGPGFDVHLTLRVDGCATRETHGEVQVAYQETETWIEHQTRWIDVYEPRQVPVIGRTCHRDYEAGVERCYQFVAYYRTTTERVRRQVTEPVEVSREVTKYRTEPRHTRFGTARWRVEVTTPDGTATIPPTTTEVDRTGTSPVAAADVWSTLSRRIVAEAGGAALPLARERRVRALLDASDPETPEGRESRLAALAAGVPLTEPEIDALSEAMGLPREVYAPDPVAVGDIAPAPVTIDTLGFALPPVTSGLVRNGYPPLLVSFAGAFTEVGDYAAHPTPRLASALVHLSGNASLTTGMASQGFGLHVTGDADLQAGSRLHRGHDYGSGLPDRNGDPARETRLGIGVRGGAAGLAGFRTTPVALFAGIGARAHLGTVGAVTAGGWGLPFTGRLEIRPVPRSPVILDAWYGDLREPAAWGLADRDLGARLSIPLTNDVDRRSWLTVEHSAFGGRTQLPGFSLDQRVEGGERRLTRTWVGYSLGY